MTTEQATRAAELAAFFFHDDRTPELGSAQPAASRLAGRDPIEVPVLEGPYAPGERALIHTVTTELHLL